jgi:exonuclease VII small subunit
MSTQPPEPTEITFAAAYERLKEITDCLNSEEVEADELVELLREAKGLEVVLREHLDEIEQEVTALEKGEGIAAYKIVRTADLAPEASDDDEDDVPADSGDFDPLGDGDAAGVPARDEDLPF